MSVLILTSSQEYKSSFTAYSYQSIGSALSISHTTSSSSSVTEKQKCVKKTDGFIRNANNSLQKHTHTNGLRGILKHPKKNGATSTNKKSVKFADFQGQKLERVHEFEKMDEYDNFSDFLDTLTIIDDAYLKKIDNSEPQLQIIVKGKQREYCRKYSWEKLTKNGVCLESIKLDNDQFVGTIRVVNWSYKKDVTVRWTSDNWISYHDTAASFMNTEPNDKFSDLFVFNIPCLEERIEFAIRYCCNEKEYWDNNDTKNYIIKMKT